SRYPLAARIVSQLGEKFFKADTQLRHLGHFASHGIPTSGPVAQYSELAADRLVASSSPPRPPPKILAIDFSSVFARIAKPAHSGLAALAPETKRTRANILENFRPEPR